MACLTLVWFDCAVHTLCTIKMCVVCSQMVFLWSSEEYRRHFTLSTQTCCSRRDLTEEFLGHKLYWWCIMFCCLLCCRVAVCLCDKRSQLGKHWYLFVSPDDHRAGQCLLVDSRSVWPSCCAERVCIVCRCDFVHVFF